MSRVDRIARAVAARIASEMPRGRGKPSPATGLASALASAITRRLNKPGRHASPRGSAPSRLAAAVVSAVGTRLALSQGRPGSRPQEAASLAPKSLQGARLAGRVASQVTSRIPDASANFSSEFAAVDVAKVAAAVVSKLEARRSKGIDHVDVLASQIASRLAVPQMRGSAAGAADFQDRIVNAVVEAVRLQGTKAVEAAATAAPTAAGDDKSPPAEKPGTAARR